MSLKTCLSTFLLFVFITTTSYAQSDKVLSFSLDEAIQFALENNTEAKNSDLDAQINKKRILEIITTGLPQLDSKVSFRNALDIPVTVIPADKFKISSFPVPEGASFEAQFGAPYNFVGDFTITQLIADGRYFIGLKATKTMNAVSAEQNKLTDIEVRANVTKAYYGVLVAQEGQTIVKRNIETLTKSLNEVTELYNSGFSEELDVDRLQLQLSNLQTLDRKTALQLELAKNMLKYQMGVDHTIELALTDKLETVLAINTLDADAAFNYEARAEYRLLGLQYKMRHYDAQRTRAAYFPSLVGFAGYGWNAQRYDFEIFQFEKKYISSYWGLELHIPIFDSYRNGAVYQQKKLEGQQIMNQINDFKQSSNLQVTQTRTAYKTALDDYKEQQKNMDLAKKIYDKVTIMYQEGVGSSLELANAESSLTLTQGNFINALYELLTKKVELEKALGNY